MEFCRSNSSIGSHDQGQQTEFLEAVQTNNIQQQPMHFNINAEVITRPNSSSPASPNVRAIIKKYEPNSSASPTLHKINVTPRTIKSNIMGKSFIQENNNNFQNEKLPSGYSLTNEPQNSQNTFYRRQGGAANAAMELIQQPSFNDGGYTAKLINKETIIANNICNNSNHEIVSEFFPQNQQAHNNDDYIVEKTPNMYACPRSSSKDKCVGTNTDAMTQEIQPFDVNNVSLSDTSYQSKTTITKTPNGVRIITDIFFDSHVDPNWKGSRIETDIPPSRILKEFQDKYSDRK